MSGYELGPDITSSIQAREAEERVRVLRALLVRPLLRRDTDGELFRLARRHADELRGWLEREAGWHLLVDSESVRLLVSYVPAGPTATAIAGHHPARGRPGDPPFTRRRYVLLCLALAVLERSDLQVSLGRLAEDVLMAARAPGLEDIDFTLQGRDQRGDLVAAIRRLLSLGVLIRVAGDEESYVASAGDALYDVDRRVLATLPAAVVAPGRVAVTLGPSPGIEDIERELHAVPQAFTDEQTNRALRHRVTRKLLSDPVVYYDELPDDERAYLVNQRVLLTRRLADATGLVPELRAEGIAMVDPDDQLTDMRMPDQGTDGHATLLLAEFMSRREQATPAQLHEEMRRLADTYAPFWRRGVREPGAEAALTTGAIDRLESLGLVRVNGSGADATVIGLPALARFAVGAPTIKERKTT